MYLTVMAVAAFSFVVYLFLAPSVVVDSHPVPPLTFGIVLIVLAIISAGLWLWRLKMKHKAPLDRDEGKVSGQTHTHP
jgi:hypothetical protein